jgi:hypothetical protein
MVLHFSLMAPLGLRLTCTIKQNIIIKIKGKAKYDWWDAPGLVLITIMLESMPLGACGPPYPLTDPRLLLHENTI